MRNALVCGAGGFIGRHLVIRLKADGCWVRGVDLKKPRFAASTADDFVVGDLRDISIVDGCFDRPIDEAYQLAADMIAEIAGKQIAKSHKDGPTGVLGRPSDHRLYYDKIGWKPSLPLRDGLDRTYAWIDERIARRDRTNEPE